MRTKHTPFLRWTKKEITGFCITNGYGEPKYSGKNKTMYIKDQVSNWANNIIIELAAKLGYTVKFN